MDSALERAISLRDQALEVLVNAEDFAFLTGFNELKRKLEVVDQCRQRVNAITQRFSSTSSDLVTAMEDMLSANDYELLTEYTFLRDAVRAYEEIQQKMQQKYGAQTAFLFDIFSKDNFAQLKHYNKTVEERKFAQLSLFLKAVDKNTEHPKYIPLEYDYDTGLAGINLQKDIGFQQIYLGHKVTGFADEAEYSDWTQIPKDLEGPIGWESMNTFMNARGPAIYHKPSGREPVSVFSYVSHSVDDDYLAHQNRDGLWNDKVKSDDEGADDEASELPNRSAAYWSGHAEEVVLADYSLVDEGKPGYDEIQKDPTLLNPVFWYEFVWMNTPVTSEGEEVFIRKIQNVGLAYYAMPAKLLSYAVSKLPKSGKRRKVVDEEEDMWRFQ